MTQSSLERGVTLLRGTGKFDSRLVDAFAQRLMEAPDEELFRMNPLQYARVLGVEERVSVDLFLYATHAGLLEFSWGLLCPHCSGFLTTPGALRSLQQDRSCSLCECAVGAGDDNLEVAFSVSPAVRRTRFHSPDTLDFAVDGLRMIFSPSLRLPAGMAEALSAGVVGAARVPYGGAGTIHAALTPGLYRLVVPAEHAWLHLTCEEGASTDPLEVDAADGQMVPFRATVGPGPVEIRIRNRTQRGLFAGLWRAPEGGARLKDIASLAPFLSGKRLVTTQAFRDLFRSESIPSAAGLEFKSLTVLFTDLKGSTELYERIGDLRAYGLVREHFDLLRQIIDQCGGSMVKTIGDAIMASFAEVGPAMEAAARMREEVCRIGAGELSLKVGLHAGPCIAVELNEQLDYFGQTVNVAARVQNLAQGGEIVCTEPVWNSQGVQERAAAAKLRSTRDRAQLKGVEGDVTVYRLDAA